MKLHAGHMEVAVANLIGYRTHTIVPNVSWGLGLNHECDMLVLDQKGRFTEVEIKISRSDLRADFKKKHGHQSKFISRLVYAVPEEMKDYALELIPLTAGLIYVHHYDWNGKIQCYARWERLCRHDTTKKPDQKTLNRFYHLGCMRIWSLKEHSYK